DRLGPRRKAHGLSQNMTISGHCKAGYLQKISPLDTEEICQLIHRSQVGLMLAAFFYANQLGHFHVGILSELFYGESSAAPRELYEPAEGNSRLLARLAGNHFTIENRIDRERAGAEFGIAFQLGHTHAPILGDLDTHVVPPFAMKASAC